MNDMNHLAFPPNGKVLVVGMASQQLQSMFGKRVHWMNHWELFSKESFPSEVAAVCISAKIQPEHQLRIRSLAQSLGINRFEVEENASTVQERLKFWFTNGGEQKPDKATTVLGQFEGEVMILTNRIRPLKGQPRTHFSFARMKELITSIKAIGQQTPIIVRRIVGDPNYDYELLDGERRLRACTFLGIPEMQAVIRAVENDEEQFVRSFVANFAREGHTPLDTARSIAKMLSFSEFKQMGRGAAIKRIADIAGKSEVWVYQYLRLLTLPNEVQRMLEPDENDRFVLPMTMGMFLCTIQNRDIQLKVCEEVVSKKLNMNQARNVARRLAIEAGLKAGSAQRSPHEDYRIMRNFLRKTVEGAEGLLTMPHRSLDELFEHRGLEERKKAVSEIETAIKLLGQLKKAVELKKPVPR